ncbi:bifunctional DNA primase/polymerase [Kitasatospora sp. NPDC004723]|uniref:bifunctional DNA primase/polymerase n=1 Tax=Kitasatospora sp. NPDC004723 TaxID=3154288 RepID=UPI0033A5B81E
MSAEPTVEDVVDLVERHLAVFPLPRGGRRPDSPGWSGRCLTTADAVRSHWPAGANVGIGCRVSAIVGLDLDLAGDGAATLADMCTAHAAGWAQALDTLTVRTPSGGSHLYFRVAHWCTIPSSSGVLGPGIDVRGPGARSGGYLIGPGSTVDGTAYTITRDRPIRPLPAWLWRRLTGEQPVSLPPRHPGEPVRWWWL